MHVAIVSKVFPTSDLVEQSEGRFMASTLLAFTDELLERGVEVSVVADTGGENTQEPRVVNTDPIDIPVLRYLDRIPSTVSKLQQIHDQDPVDIVLCWDWSGVKAASRFCSRNDLPLVCSLRGLMPADYKREVYSISRFTYWLWLWFETGLRRCDLVVANSSNTAKSVHATVPVEIIHNGVDYDHFTNAEPANIASDGDTIAYFGRFSEEKGLRHLFEAMQSIDAELLLYGDGPQKAELETLAAELGIAGKIFWQGLVPPENVASHMKAVDAVILPSIIEGFGSTILEAMAAGTPIICTTGTGGIDVVTDGKNGMLVEPRDGDALQRKITQVLGDGALRETITQNGKDTAEMHTWKNVVDQYMELFEELKG